MTFAAVLHDEKLICIVQIPWPKSANDFALDDLVASFYEVEARDVKIITTEHYWDINKLTKLIKAKAAPEQLQLPPDGEQEPHCQVADLILLVGTTAEARDTLANNGCWYEIKSDSVGCDESWLLYSVPAARPRNVPRRKREAGYQMWLAKDKNIRPFRIINVIHPPEKYDPKKHGMY